MLKLNGITPVMATCFREDDSIDDDALRYRSGIVGVVGMQIGVLAPWNVGQYRGPVVTH